MAYFAPYIDSTGVHLPTYEDRLDQLLADYRRIFGTDLVLTPDTQDYQLCSLFAKSLDDLSSLFLAGYAARDPDLASGQALDLLLPLNGVTRLPDETDAAARLRRSHAIAAPAVSTRESLLSALRSVQYLKDAVLWENDTDETDDRGLPPHSIRAVVDGGGTAPVADTIFLKKPVGVSTDGTISATVLDEFGFEHTVKFSRASAVTIMLTVTLRTLPGYNATTTPDAIKTAVKATIDKLTIGQSLIIPSLYAPILAQDDPDHPTFIIAAINASTSSTTSTLQIPIGPAERATVYLASIIVNASPLT